MKFGCPKEAVRLAIVQMASLPEPGSAGIKSPFGRNRNHGHPFQLRWAWMRHVTFEISEMFGWADTWKKTPPPFHTGRLGDILARHKRFPTNISHSATCSMH